MRLRFNLSFRLRTLLGSHRRRYRVLRSVQVVITHRSDPHYSEITGNFNGRRVGGSDSAYNNDVMVWVK